MSHTQDFHEVILKLFRVAKRDGIITENEAAIIENVKLNLEKFSQILMMAEEDGFIDEKELEELNRMRKTIQEHANETALFDDIMSQNEDTLLKCLSKLLNRYLTI